MCTEVILVRSVFDDENKYYFQEFLKNVCISENK